MRLQRGDLTVVNARSEAGPLMEAADFAAPS